MSPQPSIGYNADGSLQKTTGPNGAISYAYDDAGRLASMDTPAGAFSWDYYDRGLPESLSYPNGVAQTMQFDAAGQVTDIAHTRGTSAIVSFHYHYDANGNRDAITGADGPHAYGYDEINQLTAADHPAAQSAFNPDEFYDYDGAGNRETTHLSAAHVVNELNQLLEDDRFTYAWDLDGNLRARTEKANPSRVTTYTFNAENRLVRADLPDGTAVAFTYDVAGRRIARTVNGARTSYAHIGHDLAAEYAPSGAPAILYTYGPGIDNILAATRNGAHYYYHKDALQSVHAITDSTGAIAHEYKYDSFGNIVATNGSCSWNTVTYTGREWDISIGMHFYRARYFMPQDVLFISEDLVWSQNLYSYVNNNPITNIDPLGLSPNAKTYVMVLMDPGFPNTTAHNLGPYAIPQAAEIFKRNHPGGDFKTIDLRNAGANARGKFITELNRIRKENGSPIEGGMEVYGHGWNPHSFNWTWKMPLSGESEIGTNLRIRDIWRTRRDTFAPGANITIHACAIGQGGRSSIVSWMAHYWKGTTVWATPEGVEHFPDKGGVPARGNRFQPYTYDENLDADKDILMSKYPDILKGNYDSLDAARKKKYRQHSFQLELNIFENQGQPYVGFPGDFDVDYYDPIDYDTPWTRLFGE